MDSEFGYCTPERRSSSDQFIVEDLLNFSHEDIDDAVSYGVDHHANSNSNFNSYESSNNNVVTPPGSGNSACSGNNDGVLLVAGDARSRGLLDDHFSGELCVPYEDVAELEWLSKFVDESFSTEDLQKSHLISGTSSQTKTRPDYTTGSSETRFYPYKPSSPEPTPISMLNPETTVPGKARSKRSRPAPSNWTSQLEVLSNESPDPAHQELIMLESEPVSEMKRMKTTSKKKCGLVSRSGVGSSSGVGSGSGGADGEVRKCLHCATEKTPQWRTGPMGPKTLCNACGVRYKSGRLVPEYRPASSPTFVMAKHSNSHRKVMELRRQKDLMNQQQYSIQHQQYQHDYHQQLIHHHSNNMVFDLTANSDEYLIHQHLGPDYRQLT